MRGLGRLTATNSASKPSFLLPHAFSTCAGGRGRGRGSGSGSHPPPPIASAPSNTEDGSNEENPRGQIYPSSGLGHGRGGKPLTSTPIFPSFPPWISATNPSIGRGRPTEPVSHSTHQQPEDLLSTKISGTSIGRGRPAEPVSHSTHSTHQQPEDLPSKKTSGTSIGRGKPAEPVSHSTHQQPEDLPSKKPIFFRRDVVESVPFSEEHKKRFSDSQQNEKNLSASLFTTPSGVGRGKPAKPLIQADKSVEVNRHMRSAPSSSRRGGTPADSMQRPAGGERLSRDEAVKRAKEVLSRGGQEAGGGQGFRGQRGGRGRGRGMRARGGRGGRGRGDRDYRQDDEDYTGGLYLGDDADGEKLVRKIGEENYNLILEGFEEMSGRVLPSPAEEAYYDALHTNYLIEFEPEYLMEEFGTNPDIDEKPPIPLRDALEKMKPFLMAYEGIQSQEEWEEVINAAMERAPYLKQLIDHYSGPDRVTSRQQNQELERVAKTLPENIPSSVKRFTDRALLSLQSNPGWGFDKKCQFMDKLVWEVSQKYK